jgi:hypothetical protein
MTRDDNPSESHAQDEDWPDDAPECQWPDRDAWISLAIGAVLGVLACAFTWTRFILSYVSILIHEIGHSLFALLFGYFSIPAFNFRYGGGVALMDLDHRIILLNLAFYLGLGWVLWVNRKRRAAVVILGCLVAAYTLAALTPAHRILILWMGHGTELVFAGICFYRVLSGSSIVNDTERPAYAMLGTFLSLNAALFAWKLLTDPVERIMYEEALTTGGNPNDFAILASDYFHCGITPIVVVFLLCCGLPPVAAFLFHRYRKFIIAD